MAKTRRKSGSRKSASSKRTKSAGRGTRQKTRVARPKAEPKHIELRPIRLRLQSDVARLGAAIGGRMEAQPELEEALKRMSRWLDDIQDICGPDMMIPLP